jgi:hypothetical protein
VTARESGGERWKRGEMQTAHARQYFGEDEYRLDERGLIAFARLCEQSIKPQDMDLLW